MTLLQRILAFSLASVVFCNTIPSARACGPEQVLPIFVSTEAPDLPFIEFTNGKIGIVRPTFGRKTLVIAYRYLNGGTFTSEEQNALVDALNGKAPEADSTAAVKAWIKARKELLKSDETLPAIYTARQFGDYDFFPNCSGNAFEVATETLQNRLANHANEDGNLNSWISAQDTVFQNCSGGARMPQAVGADDPVWLRKDRDYQIAAANFYSLNFAEARTRFEAITADVDSPWQQTAEYLVARTEVRQASLAGTDADKRKYYEQAEINLRGLIGNGGKFANASRKLLALVEYHLNPEERVVELAHILTRSGNENLRQDLIDYVWLLDKFESQLLTAEAERKRALEAGEKKPTAADPISDSAAKELSEGIQRGDLIEVTIFPKKADGSADYSRYIAIVFQFDVTEKDMLASFEQKVGRPLTEEETKEIIATRNSELSGRDWKVSPNRKWDQGGLSKYEGCDYPCSRLTLDLVPEFLRADDLSDWIFTIQTQDPRAYNHALKKWRATDSPAWLLTALAKAETTSPKLAELLRSAENTDHNEPAYPTIAYHLVRLYTALGRKDAALKLLDSIISEQADQLPKSAQNQFLEQRMHLAQDLTEFLKSAQRTPAAFYEYGTYGSISEILEIEKRIRRLDYSDGTEDDAKDDLERASEAEFKELLLWGQRPTFDEKTVDILNWHLPSQLLAEAAHNQAVPDYLQRSLTLAVWTRAVLLGDDQLALSVAPDVIKHAPEMTSVMTAYYKARTAQARHQAALYVLLKFPSMSPFVEGGISQFQTSEASNYYFENAWWCKPSNTEYNDQGSEVTKFVAKPTFLTGSQLATAKREYATLVTLGDGNRYLGRQIIDWARTAPSDARIPEALFIAVKANESYKYGCNGWEENQDLKLEAERILRQRYARSPWTAKLE